MNALVFNPALQQPFQRSTMTFLDAKAIIGDELIPLTNTPLAALGTIWVGQHAMADEHLEPWFLGADMYRGPAILTRPDWPEDTDGGIPASVLTLAEKMWETAMTRVPEAEMDAARALARRLNLAREIRKSPHAIRGWRVQSEALKLDVAKLIERILR